MLRMALLSSITTLLLTFSSYTPIAAIPSCPSGTMADYIGFSAAGCQFNSLTFSDFSYSGVLLQHVSGFPFFGHVFPQPSPSEISVQPRSFSSPLPNMSAPSLGSGGAGLLITAPLPDFWDSVSISFNVSGPGIVRDDLSGGVVTIADILPFGQIFESATPGGSRPLSLADGLLCGTLLPDGTIFECRRFFDSVSFAATPFQQVDIGGSRVAGVGVDFATPEPTTLLLWGTSAAGLGLARWLKRRRL